MHKGIQFRLWKQTGWESCISGASGSAERISN